MSVIPRKNGSPCWPCIVGGVSVMVAIVGTVYLVFDYLL
jgi:hypothetical protein